VRSILRHCFRAGRGAVHSIKSGHQRLPEKRNISHCRAWQKSRRDHELVTTEAATQGGKGRLRPRSLTACLSTSLLA
jgi:hypothetical protein